jgi:hypothetical protein
MRVRPPAPPTPESFTSPLHDTRLTARLGVWLGSAITLCFLTGVLSHYQQHPAAWLPLGPDPAWGYRLNQGIHVVAGCASVPLLLAKLYSVYPRLFEQPPVRNAVHGAERASVAVLVSATIFQVVTGLMNVAQWYPWGFSFTRVHHAVAWLAIGALAVHIAVKLPVVRTAFAPPAHVKERELDPDGAGARSRRGFLVAAVASAGAVALFTAGQTVRPLRGIAFLAPRRPEVGPQGLPVNRTAAAAHVVPAAQSPGWQLTLTGPAGRRRFSLAELAALPQSERELPIACVEGWSAGARWRGVQIAELVRLAGGARGSRVVVDSLEQHGAYRQTLLPAQHAADPRTLLALELNGEPLHLDHGAPARLIAPNRPGVLQTKWVAALTVLAEEPS